MIFNWNKKNTITPLPNIPIPCGTTAVSFILDTVYIICEYNNICNEAYRTLTKAWSKIAPYTTNGINAKEEWYWIRYV